MATSRAAEVAEVLWELKRAGKVAKFSTIANRAGFSAGANGRAMLTCLKTVRRDWPHLQWWRAIKDDLMIEKGAEQLAELEQAGIEFIDAEGNEDAVTLCDAEEHLMTWDEENANSEEASATTN